MPDEIGDLELDGTRVRWVAWGKRGRPGLVLVHGGRAHWGWWTRTLTPALRRGRRVVAFDLSGHGDSGQRPRYSADAWAGEVATVVEHCVGAEATVAGHSMGGFVAIAAAARHPERVSALALLDVLVRRPDPARAGEPRGIQRRPLRVYASREEAIASFRLVPVQPVVDPDLLRQVAAASVRPYEDGWAWKFDPNVAQRFTDEAIAANLARVRCPIGYLYGEHSPDTTARTADLVAELSARPVPRRGVPGCNHHLMLDYPEAVGEGLRELLGDMGRPTGGRRRPAPPVA